MSRAADAISDPPRDLSREEAARYVGVETTKLDEMMKDGKMPKPTRVSSQAYTTAPRLAPSRPHRRATSAAHARSSSGRDSIPLARSIFSATLNAASSSPMPNSCISSNRSAFSSASVIASAR